MKISVALCTYNGDKYIKQQLESIFHQTMAVTEIVVVDDCSTDSTVQVIEEIGKQYPDIIRLIRNRENIGFRKNFEKALIECNGDYIFFSDQDDVWKNYKVEHVVSYLKESGMYGLFTNGDLIDDKGKKIEGNLFKGLSIDKYLSQKTLYPDLFAMLSLNSNFVTGATLTITKEAKNLILPFYTSRKVYHDHYIALKLAAIDKFACLNECLISYRIHSTQQIGLGKNGEVYKNLYNLYQEMDFHHVETVKSFCKFLIFRRLWSAELARVCNLNKHEKKLQKKRYLQLLNSVMTRMEFGMRCEILLRYLYNEFRILIIQTV